MAGPVYANPDFLGSGPTLMPTTPPPGARFEIPLDGVSLVEMCNGARFYALDHCESYLHAAQDFAKMYDWDGRLVVDSMSPLQPGWKVPMSARRPSVRYDVARIIESRFTALLFGTDHFPEIHFADDPDAEDFVKWLARESRIQQRFIHARSLGSSTGSVVISWAFKGGKPRVEVHNAKHCRVLEWEDRAEFRVRSMLKAYKYPKQVFDPKAKKIVTVDYYYARYWDGETETTWEPITMDMAMRPDWSRRVPSTTVERRFGFTPVYWIQNIPCDEDEDGFSDFHGLMDNFDEINRILSGASRGVKANSDPTLVVKADPQWNEGHVQKGAGAAIFSPNGADYLVLPPDTVKALFDTLDKIVKGTLDVASVVLVDPDSVSGEVSSLSLKMLFAPMLARADIYREQYGEMGLKRILLDMLKAARVVGAEAPRARLDENGVEVGTEKSVLVVPPRVERAGEEITKAERKTGESEEIELNWLPYFPPTWLDIKTGTEAVQAANGGKPVISQRTAVAAVQSFYGVTDVAAEIAAIEEDGEKALARAQQAMSLGDPGSDEDDEGKGPKPAALDPSKPKSDDETGDEDDVEPDDEA